MSEEKLNQIIENVNRRNLINCACGCNISNTDNEIMELIDFITKLNQKYNKALKILSNMPPCEFDNFMDKNADYCSMHCGTDDDVFIQCWDKFIEQKLEESK